MMEYKGYMARVEFDESANVFHGQVINLRDIITFQGESVTELQKAFQESVDDYLAFCASRHEEPEKPFSGKFLVRIDPDVHRKAALAAGRAGDSLNVWVGKAITQALEPTAQVPYLNTETVRAFRTVLQRQTRVHLKQPEQSQHRLVLTRGFETSERVTPIWDMLISATGGEYERFIS
jgi:predicted HicB family RNase H-like nuclease